MAIDLLFVVISFLINSAINKKAKNKLEKIVKKAGNGNKAKEIVRIANKRLQLKIKVWGIKFNLGLNLSSFFVSSIYSFASNYFSKKK